MDWFSLLPPVALCIALLFGPGLLIAAAARLRGIDAVAVAPPLSVAVVALSAVGAALLGLRWALWLPFAAALLVALGVLVLCLLARRLRAEDLPRTQTEILATRWFSREQLAFWAAGALAAVLMLRHLKNALGNPHWFSQTFDNNFHLNAVRWIVEHGNGSSLAITSMTVSPGKEYFYPAAWHDVVSLLFMDGGAAGIPEATNAMVLVVGALVWPLGMLFLLRCTLRLNLPALCAAAVMASAFAAYPILLLNFGVLYPNFLGIALLPAGLGLVVQLFRVTPVRRTTTAQSALLGLLACLGIALAHPNAVMSLIVMALPVVAVVLVRAVSALVQGRLRPWAAAVQVLLCLLGFWTVWLLWGIVRPDAEAATWNPGTTDSAAFGEALLNSPLSLTQAQWWLSVPVWAGLLLLLRSRRNLWLPLSYAVVVYYYICVRSLNWDQDRMWATGVWYNDPYRLAALLPVVSLPLAAVAVHLLSERLMAVPALQQALRNPRRLVAATTVLVLVLAVALTQFSRPLRQISDSTYGLYALDNHAQLVGADEMHVLQKVDGIVPEQDTVMVNPFTGGALAYALADRKVSAYHTIFDAPADFAYLNQHLNQARTDPRVCRIVRKHHAYYALDFGTQEVNGYDHTDAYRGLRHLEADGAGKTVAQTGGSRLVEITACE